MINLKERSRKWLKEFWPISRPLWTVINVKTETWKIIFASGWHRGGCWGLPPDARGPVWAPRVGLVGALVLGGQGAETHLGPAGSRSSTSKRAACHCRQASAGQLFRDHRGRGDQDGAPLEMSLDHTQRMWPGNNEEIVHCEKGRTGEDSEC